MKTDKWRLKSASALCLGHDIWPFMMKLVAMFGPSSCLRIGGSCPSITHLNISLNIGEIFYLPLSK